MAKLSDLTLIGKSGTKYSFEVYWKDEDFKAVGGGVYAITRRQKLGTATQTHDVIYLGQTSDYQPGSIITTRPIASRTTTSTASASIPTTAKHRALAKRKTCLRTTTRPATTSQRPVAIAGRPRCAVHIGWTVGCPA